MKAWIRRWLEIDYLEYLETRLNHCIADMGAQIRQLQRDLELARAAIRENTLPMEERKAASDRIAEEVIKKIRGT